MQLWINVYIFSEMKGCVIGRDLSVTCSLHKMHVSNLLQDHMSVKQSQRGKTERWTHAYIYFVFSKLISQLSAHMMLIQGIKCISDAALFSWNSDFSNIAPRVFTLPLPWDRRVSHDEVFLFWKVGFTINPAVMIQTQLSQVIFSIIKLYF